MKLISNQISPQIFAKDVLPLCVSKAREIDFTQRIGGRPNVKFHLARYGLREMIRALNLPKTSKIAIPAYTCAVVALAFLDAGYQIEWIDTDQNGVMDLEKLKKTENVSLAILIHAFGVRADTEAFAKVCKNKGILLVEDFAHWMPDEGYLKKTKSSIQVFSFGREKDVSCVSGGIISWDPSCYQSKNLSKLLELDLESQKGAWNLLLNPLIYSMALPVWHAGGKILPMVALKLKLLPLAVHSDEKKGKLSEKAQSLNPRLQKLLHSQLEKHDSLLKTRKEKAEAWEAALKTILSKDTRIIVPPNYFRVILVFKNKGMKERFLKKFNKKWHLRDWDGVPVAPLGTDLKVFGYEHKSCPNAENYSQNTVMLPTNPRVNLKDIEGVF